jgi:sec-independent protein translocase protein TatA
MTTLASLFNLAGPDLIIIFFIILLLFGAKKLPELAKGLGSAVKEFARAKDEFEHEITHPVPPSQPAQPTPQIDEAKPAKEQTVAKSEEASPEVVHQEETAVPTSKVI